LREICYPKDVKKHFYKNEISKLCDGYHLTVDEIFEKIVKKNPKAGRSTIYRNVQELVEEGKLKQAAVISGKAKYEKICHHHAHLIDEKTGTVQDVEITDLKKLILLPAGFEIGKVDVNIFGRFTENKK